MKRLFDIAASFLGLCFTWPLIAVAAFLVWRTDGASPWYIAPRVGRGNLPFRMFKLRTMRVFADKTGVTSTAGDDPRITRTGQTLRRFKLDELPQLWNVLRGDMSLVGPRPQVPSGVALYTPQEMRMLSVRPGITDFSSIVFADEGDILAGSANPDADYDRLIRPWKSRLALFYADHPSIGLDIFLIVCTVTAVAQRSATLQRVANRLHSMGADPRLVAVARRTAPLVAGIPP